MPRLTHKLTAFTLALFALACACLASLAPVSRRAAAHPQSVSIKMSGAAKELKVVAGN